MFASWAWASLRGVNVSKTEDKNNTARRRYLELSSNMILYAAAVLCSANKSLTVNESHTHAWCTVVVIAIRMVVLPEVPCQFQVGDPDCPVQSAHGILKAENSQLISENRSAVGGSFRLVCHSHFILHT